MAMNQLELLALSVVPALTYPALSFAYRRRRNVKLADVRRLGKSRKIRDLYAWAHGAPSPEDVFHRTTAGGAYLIPLALNVVTTTAFVAAFFYRATDPSTVAAPLQALFSSTTAPAIAGFAGSYLWSHYDLLRRFSTFDLSPNVLYLVWLRLVAGALTAAALTAPLVDSLRVPVAFAVGAFPLAWLQAALRALLRRQLTGSPETQSVEPPNLHCLQGATEPIIERLAEEGITSTQHLALADPLRLFLRTNLELTIILDLVDQACLHLYVGDKLTPLRSIGLRSAIEVAELDDYLSSDDEEDQAQGTQLVNVVAAILGIEGPAVCRLVESLYYDPQVSFIWDLWGEAFGTGEATSNVGEGDEAPSGSPGFPPAEGQPTPSTDGATPASQSLRT